MIAAALAIILELGLLRTKWGIGFRAFGSRPEAARVSGVPPRTVKLAAYLWCSVISGLAAVFMMGQVGIGDPVSGGDYTLASIAAAVIGGASLFGARGSFYRRFAWGILDFAGQRRDDVSGPNGCLATDIARMHDHCRGGALLEGEAARVSAMNVQARIQPVAKEELMSSLPKGRISLSEFSWIWLALALLAGLSAILAPGTLRPSSILATLPFASMLAIVAVGQTLVVQQRGLDMSAAGVVALLAFS